MYQVMSNASVAGYGAMYESPEDLDLWTAGISERPLPGSMVGDCYRDKKQSSQFKQTLYIYHVIRSVPHLRASSAGSSTTSGSSFNQDTVCDLLNSGAHRFGDRYWYENSGWPSSFTIEQVIETEKYCV